MKNIATALIASFALMGAAQAATPNGDPNNTPFQGVYSLQDVNGISRSQVQAELQAARTAGLTATGDIDNTPFAATADSGVTRDAVSTQARESGAMAFGEPNNTPFEG